MKAFFYLGLLLLALFEFFNVYFIMPMPGSQESNTLEVAYFLYRFRWIFRIGFVLMILLGSVYAFRVRRKWLVALTFIPVILITYALNFKMQADQMFKQPEQFIMASMSDNKVDPGSQVIGVEMNGQAKAYPIKFLAYHHLIFDTVGGASVLITYCSVCHSGRVFALSGDEAKEKFRLVGMDHYNAMFEDQTTKSWWRQATGECVAGKRKGDKLAEVTSHQLTLDEWFKINPNGLVMQADPSSLNKYDLAGKFEQGKSSGRLTRTDSIPWQEKSLVIGVTLGSVSKAYDWHELLEKNIINDSLAGQNIVLIAYPDRRSYAAFLNTTGSNFELSGDTLKAEGATYSLDGKSFSAESAPLLRIYSYQEFWHSWKLFHPATLTYNH